MARIGKHLGRSRHEQPMGHERDDAPGAGAARCPCGAQQRASGADQVVDDQRGRSRDIADEQVAGDHAGTAMLVGKSLADRAAERRLQRFAEQLRPLGAARIRRDDAELLVLQRLA